MKLGLIGKSLKHSASKVIHRLFFELTGIEGQYELFEIEDEKSIPDNLDLYEGLNFTGLNVTIPYKQIVMNHIDVISDEAMKIGAVNTILFKDKTRYGFNTDYFGFIKTLEREKIDVKDKKWLVLGYGGSARSVIAALKDLGGDVLCASTTVKGEGFVSYEEVYDISGEGIVNTTPLGMFPNNDACAVREEIFSKYKYAIDLIYNPKETLFIKYAKNKGINAVNGLYMLVSQAMKAQEIWNGRDIDPTVTEEIFKYMNEVL